MKLPITEQLFTKSKPIDKLQTLKAINLILDEQEKASFSVRKIVHEIDKTVNAVVKHLKKNVSSRLIYVGAGTSGRIGIQDAIELIPTFGWSADRIDYIMAGGNEAVLKSIENAEDDIKKAQELFQKYLINKNDVVIGLAASGNTPFTCEIIKMAYKTNALTIAISNNPSGKILKSSDYKLVLDTKEEVIAGSTRLKAGTAQKICLNIISTMVMTKLGFVRNGMMINLIPTNEKLKKRKTRIEKNVD